MLLDCKGLYRNGQLVTKVASSRRFVGEVRRVPAHPSLALSMYGVIEEGTEKVLKGRNNTGGGAAPVINITPIHKPCMGEIIS